jgi:dipeptidyl aminopeptidase/acylaminoacyl peptidase
MGQAVSVKRKTVVLIITLMGPVLFAGKAQERQFRPLPVEETLETRSIPVLGTPISLSPDGHCVAYALQMVQKLPTPAEVRYSSLTRTGAPRALLGTDIWIADTQTRESRNLTNGEGTNWAPVWSPDGRYIAFSSDRSGQSQLWLWDKSSGKLRRASGESLNTNLSIWRHYQWTNDSKHIVVGVLPEGMTLDNLLDLVYGSRIQLGGQREQTGVTVKISESLSVPNPPEQAQTTADFELSYNLFLSDIALIDVDGGPPHRLARKLRVASFLLSPNGTHIAMMSYSRQASFRSQQGLWELSVATVTGNEFNVVARDLAWDYRPLNWSLDSASVLYETHGPRKEAAVHLFSVNGGKSRDLPLPSDFAMPDSFYPGGASWLWDQRGQAFYSITFNAIWKVVLFSGESTKIVQTSSLTLLGIVATRDNLSLWSFERARSVVVLARDNENLQEGFYRVDLTTGEFTKLFTEPQTVFTGRGHIETSDNQETLVYLAESMQHPRDIWITGPDMINPRVVTATNPVFAQYELGTGRLIRWKSLDGQDLKGALLLPAGYRDGERYPLVLYIYGGLSLSTALNEWGGDGILNMQILATRGYAVLFPDTPLGVGTPMRDLAKTALPGLEKAVELGIADPNRLGIMGHSYGGYSTLALIVQSKLFKAAISISGPTNLTNAYMKTGTGGGGIGWVEEGQGAMGGSVWQYRDRFIENSPFFYLDKVQTPVLLIHGGSDQTVPVTESRIAFEALRRLGKEVVFAEYEGEGHIPSQWSYSNRLDFCNRVITWFRIYLKGDQPSGGPHSTK